jgi:hypothetical protein
LLQGRPQSVINARRSWLQCGQSDNALALQKIWSIHDRDGSKADMNRSNRGGVVEPLAVRIPSSTEWLGNSMNGRARLSCGTNSMSPRDK